MADLLTVSHLKKYFSVKGGDEGETTLKAVDDISFSIAEGETLGWWVKAAAENRPSASALCACMSQPTARSSFRARTSRIFRRGRFAPCAETSK